MDMKFQLKTSMQQRLVMTPKLQQALKLLQVPTLELEHILKQEIMQNPLLEEVDFGEEEEEEEVRDEPLSDSAQVEEERTESASDSGSEDEPTQDFDLDEYLDDSFKVSRSAKTSTSATSEWRSPRRAESTSSSRSCTSRSTGPWTSRSGST